MTLDPDPGERFSYALSDSEAYPDNRLYRIEGSWLLVNDTLAGEPDYTHEIHVTSTDRDGLPIAQSFTLMLQAPPRITKNPESSVVDVGTPLTLTAEATGTPPLDYQWWVNGLPLAGADAVQLELIRVDESTTGSYEFEVHNAYGFDRSAPATISIRSALESVEIVGLSIVGPDELAIRLEITGTGDAPIALRRSRDLKLWDTLGSRSLAARSRTGRHGIWSAAARDSRSEEEAYSLQYGTDERRRRSRRPAQRTKPEFLNGLLEPLLETRAHPRRRSMTPRPPPPIARRFPPSTVRVRRRA